MTMKPLPLREQEYRESLLRLERRAIIPLKWGMLLISITLWTVIVDSRLSPPMFALFLTYGLCVAANTYFFSGNRLASNQIRPFTLASYLADFVFVSMLVYFDLNSIGTRAHSDFYVIYFLLVMRGFALFKTLAETVFVNLLISLLYLLTFWLQYRDFNFMFEPRFSVSFLIFWLVILTAWFIFMIINRQKLELLEARERLLRADALAQAGELAAGVAHEINNPIGIIAATAEYLLSQSKASDPWREDVDAIHAEAMRCKKIVQEMLDYARPRPAGLMDVEPRALNDEVLGFVFPRGRAARFEVVREYADDPPMFKADANMVKQALLNLYINARQSIPDGREGRIVARVTGGAGMVRFEIEDNGEGIAGEDLPHIFEPFFTRKTKGTGLGLAVTQRIAEQFGGAVYVRAAKPRGAVFTLEFPASAA